MSLDIHDTMSQISIPVNKDDKYRSLHITFSENGIPYEIAEGCCAFFDAKKPDGNFIHNVCRIEGNTIIYDLTTQTTAAIGVVECEIALYDSDPMKNSNAEKITTPCFTLVVDEIIYNGEEIVSTPEVDALKEVTEELNSALADVENFVGGTRDYIDNTFANAVKWKQRGEVIHCDYVSPVEHTLKCKVESKNLIDLRPVYGKAFTENGGTLSVGTDGGVTGSGTPAGYVSCLNAIAKLDVGVYTLSWTGTSTNIACSILIRNAKNETIVEVNTENFQKVRTFDLASYPDYDNVAIGIKRANNNIALSGTAYFQLEKGSVASAFAPCIDPAQAKVVRYGINSLGEEYGRASYTPNADGTVDGIKSLAPSMTIVTDTEGAVLTCEHNKDSNAAAYMTDTVTGDVYILTAANGKLVLIKQ
jgi:hypothetical protein